MPARISICIPAYNQTKYLSKTLTSILKQSYGDYEVIITDDSPAEVVRDLVGSFDFKGKLKYFHNNKPLGSPKNWNYCISKAQGEYIKMMHHDDYFVHDDSLKLFVEAMESTAADFAFCNAIVDYEASKRTDTHSPGKANILKLRNDPSLLFLGNFLGAPSMIMYRRDPSIAFDENIKWLVDVDFYIRYLNQHPNFTYIDEPLITILADAENTVTSTCLNKTVEIFENFYLFDKIKKNLSYKMRFRCNLLLLRLLDRYHVSDFGELKVVGYTGRIALPFRFSFRIYQIKVNLIRFLWVIKRKMIKPRGIANAS